jgi:hypothetical protein
MLLAAITPPIHWHMHLIDFLNRLCQVNPPPPKKKNPPSHNWLKIHPANLIRLAFGEGETLQKITTLLQDIAYYN